MHSLHPQKIFSNYPTISELHFYLKPQHQAPPPPFLSFFNYFSVIVECKLGFNVCEHVCTHPHTLHSPAQKERPRVLKHLIRALKTLPSGSGGLNYTFGFSHILSLRRDCCSVNSVNVAIMPSLPFCLSAVHRRFSISFFSHLHFNTARGKKRQGKHPCKVIK